MPRGRKPKPIVIIEEQNEDSETLSQLPLSSAAGGDDDNGGDSAAGSSRDSGSASGRADSDSDSGITGERFGNSGRLGTADRSSENGDFDAANGSLQGGVRPSEDGGGTSNRAGRRGRARSDSSRSGRTQENSSPDTQSGPREVAYDSLGKGRGKKTTADTISLEFITEGVGLSMYGIGMLFNDVETWQVPQDDALEFATRLHKWINSSGGKKASALQKFIAKNEPLIGVGIGAATLIVPRIIQTKRNRQRVNLQKASTATAASGNPAPIAKPAASPTGSGQGISVDGVRSAANGRPVEPSAVNARSFRREDFRSTFGHDDG